MQRLGVHAASVGIVTMSVTAVVAAPLVPMTQSPPATVQQVRLVAATVPPGGLITSFLHNQSIYCSIICPLLAQSGATAVASGLAAPGVFLAALPVDGLLRAIGVAAASITGPTDAAVEKAIAADAAIPAQRALNAFEVGVVGVLNIVPAFARGPGAVLAAIQAARQQTFDALNAPVVPNPTPTVTPHGVFQVAVVQAINIVAAVIFPAFNDVLAGAFQIPNAVAQTLASTGNPVAAIVAGLGATTKVLTAAGTVIGKAVATAINNVRATASQTTPSGLSTPVAAATAVPNTRRSTTGDRPTGATKVVVAQNRATSIGSKSMAHVGDGNGAQTRHERTAGAPNHPSVRGSHAGRPSRPALRAKR